MLGSKFVVNIDNIPLANARKGNLSTSQIQWLSKLALFDFAIKYRRDKSRKATYALSQCQLRSDSSIVSDSDSNEIEVVSYSVCNIVNWHLVTTKVSNDLKMEA